MPYDQNLAERIRTAVKTHPGIIEKKMFGGVGFILSGNTACSMQGDDLIVRVGAENNDAGLSQLFVRPFRMMPAKPMVSWILVAPEGITPDQDLQYWVELGYEYASSLPEKV